MKDKIIIMILISFLCLLFFTLNDTLLLNAQTNEKDKNPVPKEQGGNPTNLGDESKVIKDGIEKSLKYLVKTQSQDGSWGDRFTIAITSISGLAFLAYDAKPFDSPYSDTILKAYNFLMKHLNNGQFPKQSHTWIHGQGFATLFLSEFYGKILLADNKPKDIDENKLKSEIEKAVQLIEKSQSISGGWWYDQNSPHQHEGSTTVCAVQALRSAVNYGIRIDQKVLDKGFEYLKQCQNEDGGFDYKLGDAQSMQAGSAGAMSTLVLMKKLDYPVLLNGLNYLEKTKIEGISGTSFPYYGHFYAMMAMKIISEEYGKEKPIAFQWLANAPKELMKWQDKDGAWELKGWITGADNEKKKDYSTSLGALTLLVPNGNLSIFHRNSPKLPPVKPAVNNDITGEWKDNVYILKRDEWELRITYNGIGTRSEKQIGALFHKGQEVKSAVSEEELEIPLGKLKYYDGKYPYRIGWNFADKNLIKRADERGYKEPQHNK